MRSLSLVLLGLLATTIVGVACGSSDAKQAARRGDAGGAGEAGAAGGPSSGNDEAGAAGQPSAGGAAGQTASNTPSGGAGGVASEPGGAGGDSGFPPVTLQTIVGEWSGSVVGTYACETSVDALAIKVDGSTVSVTGWPYGANGTGEIALQADGAFTFDLTYLETDEYTPFGTIHGQFLVEPSAQHALLVLQDLGSSGGNLALLQRGNGTLPNPDILGDWSGQSVRLDSDFAVDEVFASSATFSSLDEATVVSGEDLDGAFTGDGGWHDDGATMWTLRPVQQAGKTYGGLFLMSPDQTTVAAALLNRASDDIYYNELCDQSIFLDVSLHKFGLWTRQP